MEGDPATGALNVAELVQKYLHNFLDTIKKMHCRKEVSGFPVQLSQAGNIYLFPAWESLVSDIPAGEGKTANLFLQCGTLVAGDTYILVFIRNGENFANFFRQTPIMQK